MGEWRSPEYLKAEAELRALLTYPSHPDDKANFGRIVYLILRSGLSVHDFLNRTDDELLSQRTLGARGLRYIRTRFQRPRVTIAERELGRVPVWVR